MITADLLPVACMIHTGTATGAQLYDHYGNARYSTGSMPTTKGFTVQYSDAGSAGLQP